MIVWINGVPGAGKTGTARELTALLPDGTLYDPETIADTVRALLPRKRLDEAADPQDLPVWRRLVVDAAAALLAELGGVLVVPMALLRQEHRDEIFGGLAARRIQVRHVLLAPDETILRGGVVRRTGVPEWAVADAYVIDNAELSARQTAERIAEAVRTDAARACEIVQTPEPKAETVAAGVLLFDEQDRVLLVDPTYKPGWEFPGGVVERGEAPARAGVREVAEELGVELGGLPGLLLVDWEPPVPPGYGGLRFLFDGGRLPAEAVAALRLPGPELREWRFVTEEEAASLLPPLRFERLRWALRAREGGTVVNLEAGIPIG
ncbi:NUDIX hydrolase [Streptomyces sp. NPDC089799]|uniref:NUDIX hydrolase n=1 Tax=Streptomyces sp. NPDC089799 TaxID=3155066 RepID=UPI0034162214